MSLSPRLSRKLHEALGDEAAEDLVTWLEQNDAQDLDLRAEMRLGFARIDTRFETVRADMAELRQEFHREIAQLRSETKDIKADLIKWSFAFWVAAVAANATIAALLR